MKLRKYIKKNFASQVEFANFIGKARQRISEMINADYIVIKGTVYSKRFDLPKKESKNEI